MDSISTPVLLLKKKQGGTGVKLKVNSPSRIILKGKYFSTVVDSIAGQAVDSQQSFKAHSRCIQNVLITAPTYSLS